MNLNRLVKLLLSVILALLACVLAFSFALDWRYTKTLTVIFWAITAVYQAVMIGARLKLNTVNCYNQDIWIREQGSQEWKGPFKNVKHAMAYIRRIDKTDKCWLLMTGIELLGRYDKCREEALDLESA